MNILKDTIAILPVILIDDTDFKTPETAVSYDDVTCKYLRLETGLLPQAWVTKSLGTNDWIEIGNGLYHISFSAADIGEETGQFYYHCSGTGLLPFWGTARITYSQADLDSKFIKFLFTTLAGHGLHVLARDSNLYNNSIRELKQLIEELPEELQGMTNRYISFFSKHYGPMKLPALTNSKKSKKSKDDFNFDYC